jgi:hypothetical protein
MWTIFPDLCVRMIPCAAWLYEVEALQVYRNNLVPVLLGHLGDGLPPLHGRTVDEDVQPAKRVEGI